MARGRNDHRGDEVLTTVIASRPRWPWGCRHWRCQRGDRQQTRRGLSCEMSRTAQRRRRWPAAGAAAVRDRLDRENENSVGLSAQPRQARNTPIALNEKGNQARAALRRFKNVIKNVEPSSHQTADGSETQWQISKPETAVCVTKGERNAGSAPPPRCKAASAGSCIRPTERCAVSSTTMNAAGLIAGVD